MLLIMKVPGKPVVTLPLAPSHSSFPKEINIDFLIEYMPFASSTGGVTSKIKLNLTRRGYTNNSNTHNGIQSTPEGLPKL